MGAGVSAASSPERAGGLLRRHSNGDSQADAAASALAGCVGVASGFAPERRRPLMELESRATLPCGRRLDFALFRPVEEISDFLREQIRIEPLEWGFRVFLFSEFAKEAAAGRLLNATARELRDRVGLQVLGAGQRAKVGDELLFVARRQQRGDENDIRQWASIAADCRLARFDQDQIRANLFADDALEDSRLFQIRLDRENQRHLRFHHEEHEDGPDGGEDQQRRVFDALVACRGHHRIAETTDT